MTENETPVAEGKALVLEAVAPSDVVASPFGTKTTMVPNEGNYSVHWSENDAISVNEIGKELVGEEVPGEPEDIPAEEDGYEDEEDEFDSLDDLEFPEDEMEVE